MTSYNLIVRLWAHIAPLRRKQLIILLLIMILASFAEVISIGSVLPFLGAMMTPDALYSNRLLQPIIQTFKINDSHQLLFTFTSLFIVAALISGGMRLILLWAQTKIGYAIGSDLGIKIYKNTLYQPYSVHVARNSSEIIAGISTKTRNVISNTLMPILLAASSIFLLVTIAVAILLINPLITLVTFLSFGIIYILIAAITKKYLSAASYRISRESSQVVKALQEGLGGVRDVLIDSTQEVYCSIYGKADASLNRALASVQIIGGSPRYLMESLGMVLIAMLAYTLGKNQDGAMVAIPILGAFALGAQRLLPVFQQLYASWSSIKGGQDSFIDVLVLLEQTTDDSVYSSAVKPILFNKSICIRNLYFKYSEKSLPALDNISLEITKGNRIGFIGTTGSGKSTLLDVIMGLLPPTQGQLLIDGESINASNSRNWQRHIAHVPQSIYLADSSIAENIAFGVPFNEIDFDCLRKAAEEAQIAKTIEAWSMGYQTIVGERGVRLSGGQRQRIGIARALYKSADVIVLDEATSALDDDTEQSVMGAIELMGVDKTVLIVAHRLTTLKGCDVIVRLEDGRIKAVGNYQTLALDKIK